MTTAFEALQARLADDMLNALRLARAYEDASLEDAERSGAEDGTRVCGWELWTDANGVKHWLLAR